MKLPTTKQELLDKVRASHRKLGVEAATIPASHYRHTAMIWQEPRLLQADEVTYDRNSGIARARADTPAW